MALNLEEYVNSILEPFFEELIKGEKSSSYFH